MSAVLGAMLIKHILTFTSYIQTEINKPFEASLTALISLGMAIAIYDLKNIFIDLEKQKDILRTLTQTDLLTGALSRGGIMSHLELEFQRAQRNRKPVAIFMIDKIILNM